MNQENIHLIGLIVIVWILIFAIRFGKHMDKRVGMEKKKVEKVVERACPPHVWGWEDQIGMEGVSYIRCNRCRRSPGWEDKT